MYSETYKDLCHGTDKESAAIIEKEGFKIRGNNSSWCGRGVYFYDIKKKAWWAADRKCREIRKETGKKVKPTVIFADIIDIADEDIFDLRVSTNMCDFESFITPMLGKFKLSIPEIENETERIIMLRAALIGYYVNSCKKKLVIGNFKQRPQKDYIHTIEFADSLDIIFGIETIYCVKDTSIISNIHQGGTS